MNTEFELKKQRPSFGLLILSLLFPLLGFILYFSKRKKQPGAAQYGWAGVIGMLLTFTGKHIFPGMFDRVFSFVTHEMIPLLFGVLNC